MKPEPLKGKSNGIIHKFYFECDIKSAVEWLKIKNLEALIKLNKSIQDDKKYTGMKIKQKIGTYLQTCIENKDKAFEDIIKK